MRVTIPIASAGREWWPTLPKIREADCFARGEDGEEKFDEAAFRRQIAGNRNVNVGSRDGIAVCGFATMLFDALGAWLDDNSKNEDTPRMAEVKRRMSRKIGSGRVSYVRVDITDAVTEYRGTLIRAPKVRVTHNDMGVVQPLPHEHRFAMVVATFCDALAARSRRNGEAPVFLAPETEALQREVEAVSERRELAEKRAMCEFRTASGHCSPCQFGCPLFKAGKCAEVEECR